MKYYSIIVAFLLISSVATSQTNCTLKFDNGVMGQSGYLEGGIQVELPLNYKFYVFGERKIVNIERLDSFEEFKAREKELLEKSNKILFQKLCGNDFGCGDTEISYEIHNSEMFAYCRVVYFYYENFLSTTSILGGWHSLADGDHTIVIAGNNGVVFQKKITLKEGLLVN